MRRDRWMPTARSLSCSKHFTQESFHRFGLRVQLIDSAVPTIFDIHVPHHLQKKVTQRKFPAVRVSAPPLKEPDVHSRPLPQQSTSANPLAEHSYATMDSPRKLKCRLHLSEDRLEKCRKKLKVVHQRTRRLKRKVETMNGVVDELRNDKLISTNCVALLEGTVDGIPKEVMTRIIECIERKKIICLF
ncbi:THAP domain-containing protein 1-like [Lytechinus variegatus]|uniref:THAP domain-containing protein 1-like n=1 Tax=Lytechinus variegatus TaxID=7654 RepID=UPI001BB0DC60|nr:THAP domain-containing protein 1-like [Lytechinus variegatus]